MVGLEGECNILLCRGDTYTENYIEFGIGTIILVPELIHMFRFMNSASMVSTKTLHGRNDFQDEMNF